MLTKLRIKNFKSWRDTGDIRMAPLTVFFGTNSSGKSSLGQLLLLLKQTAQSPDRKRVLHPGGDEKSPIDLGSYGELVHKHDEALDIDFELQWMLPKRLVAQDVLTKARYSGDSLKFSSQIGMSEKSPSRLVCRTFQYTLGNTENGGMTAGMQSLPNKPGKYELSDSVFPFTRTQGRVWPLPPPTRFYGFPDEVSAYYQNADVLRDLTLAFETELNSIHYLGPLREFPKRSYIWTGEVPEHVGFQGKETVAAILAAKDRKISRGNKTKYQPFEQVIASWLQELGVVHSFEIEQIGKGRREYEIRVQVTKDTEPVKLPDIGFGVSQVMPVVVECFYASSNSTILMEQPEIHLHPSVQAKLADVFTMAIKAKEDGKDRNMQLIVESHSEHFLRRLQRKIADGDIAPESVAVYFCEVHGSESQLTPLEMDDCGNISNWPENFFGDQMSDIAAVSEATIRRRMAEREQTDG